MDPTFRLVVDTLRWAWGSGFKLKKKSGIAFKKKERMLGGRLLKK